MTEMLNACSSLERDVARYAYGSDLAAQEKQAVEEHLQNCADCRELVAFIRQTRSVAQDKRVKRNARTPECLDVDTIALFEEGRLPAEIEERAREHILNCARCRDQYLLWCRLTEEAETSASRETATKIVEIRPEGHELKIGDSKYRLHLWRRRNELVFEVRELQSGTGLPLRITASWEIDDYPGEHYEERTWDDAVGNKSLKLLEYRHFLKYRFVLQLGPHSEVLFFHPLKHPEMAADSQRDLPQQAGTIRHRL